MISMSPRHTGADSVQEMQKRTIKYSTQQITCQEFQRPLDNTVTSNPS